MMNQKILIYLLCGVILLSTALIVNPKAAFACSCAMSPSAETQVKDELGRKTAIFTGKVIKVTQPPKKKTMSSADLVQVDFEVATVWKGKLKQQTAVYTAMSSASCGYEKFNAGDTYIVSANDRSGKLETGICDLTKLVSAAGEELKVLGNGYNPLPLSAGEVLPSNGGKANESGPTKLQIIIGALALFMIIGIVVVRARRRQ